MTNEEYLLACGWEIQYSGAWYRQRSNHYSLAEAVETQLAEDRARLNYVRAHSALAGGMLVATAPKSTLFSPDRLGQSVSAQRSGTITLRTDDGEEHAIAVAAGDTAKTVAETVAMLLTMSLRDRA